MAAIPIQISGTLYDKTGRTTQQVYLIGSASIVGLSVGGGPIVPPEDIQPPLGIWGGPFDPPHPEHPIFLPPDCEEPPPEFPNPPENATVVKEPPPGGGWGWGQGPSGQWSWFYAPGPGSAGPKT